MPKTKRFFQILGACFAIYKILKKEKDLQVAGTQINMILEQLGPTFIKFGQMLSMRSDMIPDQLANALRQLLDHGQAIELNRAEEMFQNEFKKPLREQFESFESTPFAVASLSQVHKAKFKGQVVAVKFQKPDIEKIILEDLAIIRKVVTLIGSLPFSGLRNYKTFATSAVEEFFKWIKRELDYRLEALNITRIGGNLKEIEYFVAPGVIYELSSQRILTMSYIDGVSLNTIFDKSPNQASSETIEYSGIKLSKKEFISRMISIVCKQIIEDGYFHADPHPANILLTLDHKIAYVDFGITGALSPKLRESILAVILSMMERDVPATAKNLMALDEIDGSDKLENIETGVRSIFDGWQSGSVIEKTTAELFFKLLLLARDSKIDLPLTVLIIGKTLLEYDGVLRKFDPQLDIMQAVRDLMKTKSANPLEKIGEYIPGSIKELVEKNGIADEIKDLAGKLLGDGIDFSVHFGPSKDSLANKN